MLNMPVTKIKFTLRKRGKSTWCLPKSKQTCLARVFDSIGQQAPPIF